MRDNFVPPEQMDREISDYTRELAKDLKERSLTVPGGPAAPQVPGRIGNLGGPDQPEQPAVPEVEVPAVKVPKAGEVMQGFTFKGGDPADPSAWEALTR